MIVPCSFIIYETPWKKPLYLGLADLWSLMNLTLTVSIGVTANIASQTPAPKPHRTLICGLRLPFSSTAFFFSISKEPNLWQKLIRLGQMSHNLPSRQTVVKPNEAWNYSARAKPWLAWKKKLRQLHKMVGGLTWENARPSWYIIRPSTYERLSTGLNRTHSEDFIVLKMPRISNCFLKFSNTGLNHTAFESKINIKRVANIHLRNEDLPNSRLGNRTV